MTLIISLQKFIIWKIKEHYQILLRKCHNWKRAGVFLIITKFIIALFLEW